MLRRFLFNLCLILAVLVAQQVAFTHALFHDYAPLSEGNKYDSDESDSLSLCEFHLVFAQILSGSVGSTPPIIGAIEDEFQRITHYFQPYIGSIRLFSFSRAPPLILLLS